MGSSEKITYCICCGAYAWRNHKDLSKACRGAGAKGLKNQRYRLAAGKFPHAVRDGWTISNKRPMRAEELRAVWLATGRPFLKVSNPGQQLARRSASDPVATALPAKRDLLLAYGVELEDLEGFLAWVRVERAERTKAKGVLEDPPTEEEPEANEP